MFRRICAPTLIMLAMASDCAAQKPSYEHQEVYDLNASTEIILSLLKHDELHKILLDVDADSLDTLIKNMSPAQIALESEVLSYPGVCALICVSSGDWTKLHDDMVVLAHDYAHIKFVKIDTDKLFTLVQYTQIESFPAIIFIQDRQEIDRIEPLDIAQMCEYLSTISI